MSRGRHAGQREGAHKGPSRASTGTRITVLSAVLALIGMVGLTWAPAMADDIPDPTNPTAVLQITKTASASEVSPGDSLTYSIDVGCSAISATGCDGAITTDVLPEPLVIDQVVPSGPNSAAQPVIDGQKFTVTWTQPLDGGGTGMTDNTTSHIEVTVHVPEDVPYDLNGTTLTNNATAEATNALDVTDSADVTLNVPLNLDTTATKSLDPTTALAAAGTPVTARLGGSNDSNASVETLVIQDPVDPTATPDPFTYLGFTGFGTITPPEGTTSTTYEVYVDGAWVDAPGGELPPGVDPADVQGTRVTFTGDIPAGATASVDLDLETTEAAAGLTEDTTITNTVQSEVTREGQNATDDASADFTFQANNIAVTANKSFDPDLVIAGGSSTVTIGGSNASPFPIDSMTITEPSNGSFPADYTFGGFTGGINYPAGATSGTVTYQPSGEQVSFADGETPAPPSDGAASVTSFTITFTGDIQPGAETSAPFDVDTDADATGLPKTVNNEVQVEGDNNGATGDATADDDLYIYDEVIEPYIDKQIRPSQIIANPGEVVTISLRGGTTERPNPPDNPDGTTGDADHIVIQDPQDPIEGNAWWNAFDLDSITQTPIPADASLTVYYYDTSDPAGGPNGDGWKVLDGPIQGPNASYSYDVPDDISAVAGGVRFDYEYTGTGDGFAPGTDLAPNFTSTLRDTGRYDGATPPYNNDDPTSPDTIIPNCAQSSATSPTPGVPGGEATMPQDECPTIDIVPVNGEGVGDLIDKDFGTSSSGGNKSVIERSGDTIPSVLSWSTGGYSGFDHVDITDISDPEGTAVADSVYDAFNLTRINPITDADDPYLKYDQVTQVLLYNGTDWVEATNDPCPTACDGTFPGMDLTAAEQQSTLGVRLTFVESDTNRGQGDLDAPPVGSGVARSLGNDRHITLVWQIRDTKRSDGSPALAVDDYNTADPGTVNNTVNATGYPTAGDPVSDNAADDVVITDVPITTTTDKTWRGGPLAIPEPGTPANEYPLSRVTVTTTNTTPMMVDQLQITDTAPGSTDTQDPFDYFNLVRISAIDVPDGATETTVTITCVDATVNTYDRDQALALLPPTMPCDGGTNVDTVQVLFDGRIVSTGQGVLSMDLRLRETVRSTGAQITPDDSPIANTAQGIVADVDAIQDCPPAQGARYACDQGTDNIELNEPTFGIDADKAISPASQKEGDDSPVVVTIGGQTNGTARPYIVQLTDDDPSFWNAMDFVQMDPSWALPTPVKYVQACYKTGGTFTDATVANDDPADVGGDWTCEDLPGGGPPFEDGDLTLQQAIDFMNSAPAGQIHGVRFRFMAGTEDGWQNPSHPHIQVPFQVQRRTDLRTGEPVPTTRSDQSAAPGETEAGVFHNTTDAAAQSVLVGLDTRLTADDTADAPYTYQHLTVGVEVDKTPSGQVQPGQTIPFKLTYTNTGEAPLTNPVFTDVLPSDADGNQLIFDPDAAPGSSPYTFELTGDAPDPPNGDPLPIDEADIDINESGDTITFAMPDGTVLEPGQTYTITIELMLRPGLTPDDVVTNTDKVIADEPFDPDNCSPNYDTDTGECWDNTSVSPVRVAALSAVKKVKADVPVDEPGVPEVYLDRDVLPAGSDLPDDYCDTAADADGFYRSPCVPETYPGDTETWRYTITNSGTLPIDDVVSIDVLPHVGDTGVIVNLPRDSVWTPTFADSLEFVSSTGTPIGDVTLEAYYSTSYTPCTDDLNPLGTPCPDGEWLPYDNSVDPAQVHSLKTVLRFPDGELFEPGDQVTLQAKTRTTPETLDGQYPVAWNTVATGGVSNDNGARAQVLATEGRKVGITYPTGPVQLQKTVTGDGAAYAPDSFTVNLACTSEGQDIDLSSVNPITLVPGADPTQVDNLPFGAECTATEADQGQSDQIIGTATVGGPEDDIALVSVENVFNLGDLAVTKAVDTDAVDQDGNPITYDGPFTVAVDCTFLGEEVYADGFSADIPMTATIGDGDTATFTGLPTGAECTVTEPDNADAASTDISPQQPVTIGDNTTDEGPVEVTVTNNYTVGSLHLIKESTGGALNSNPSLADGPFTFHVQCTLTDASHVNTTVYDDDIVLPDDDNVDNDQMDYRIDNLPTGAVCEIAETDPAGATEHTVDPGQVTIGAPGDNATVQVTATNTFGPGSMAITKTVDTGGATGVTYGPFQVAVSCTYQGEDVYADGYGPNNPMTHTINGGETWTLDGLPIGAECTTTEPDDAGASSVDISPETITIDGDAGAQGISVINHYTVGSLELTKQVDGDAIANNPVLADGPFELHVQCTLTDESHPDGATVYDKTFQVADGETVSIENLPTGAECDITEPDNGGATSSTVEPDHVTIDDAGNDDPVTVTAINTFDAGDMSVTKTVDSDAVDQDGDSITYGPFQISVRCTYQGNEVIADGYETSPMRTQVSDGQTADFTGLPVGATCVTTEPDNADAADVAISPRTVVIDDDSETVQAVDVTNHFDVGSLQLIKEVPEEAEQYLISQGPFTLHVECTLTDATHPDPNDSTVYSGDVVLQGKQPLEQTIDNLPLGADCVVTETDPGASTGHTMDPADGHIVIGDTNGDGRVGPRDEGADSTVTLTVSNEFAVGALTVTKTVKGPGADLYGGGPFEVDLQCTYTDVDGNEQPIKTPGGSTRMLTKANDYTVTYDPLLLGSHCHLEETKTGGATDTVITADGQDDGDITIDSLDGPDQIELTNVFKVGKIKVKKVVKGPGNAPYTVKLACAYDVDGKQTDVDIPGGATRKLSPASGMTVVYEDLPTGAECAVTETDSGGADETTIEPSSLTVGDGQVAEVVVTNTFDPGTGNNNDDDTYHGPTSETGGSTVDDHNGLLWGALAAMLVAIAGGLELLRRRS